MTRLHAILIATVAVIAVALPRVSAADEPTPSAEPEGVFKSQLGYRSWAGEFVPIVDAQVFVGNGQGACQPSLQTQLRLKLRQDGGFSLRSASTVVATRYAPFKPKGEPVAPRCEETYEWPCYRFQAGGCRDYTLRFDQGQRHGERVEMDCPGRRGPNPDDG